MKTNPVLIKWVSCLFILLFLIPSSCKKQNENVDPDKEDPDVQKPVTENQVKGIVEFPSGMRGDSSMVVASMVEATKLKSNEFAIGIVSEQTLSMVSLTSESSDRVVMLGFAQKNRPLQLSATSTASVLLMLNPVVATLSENAKLDAIASFEKQADFALLVKEVQRLILSNTDILSEQNTQLISLINRIHLNFSSGRIGQTDEVNDNDPSKISIGLDGDIVTFKNTGSWANHTVGIYDANNVKITEFDIDGLRWSSDIFENSAKAVQYILSSRNAINGCLRLIDYNSKESPLCQSGPASLGKLTIPEPARFVMGDREKIYVKVTNGLYGKSNSFLELAADALSDPTTDDRRALKKNFVALFSELYSLLGAGSFSNLSKVVKCFDLTAIASLNEKIAAKSLEFAKMQSSDKPANPYGMVLFIGVEGIDMLRELAADLDKGCPQARGSLKTFTVFKKFLSFAKNIDVFSRLASGVNFTRLSYAMFNESKGFDAVIVKKDKKLQMGGDFNLGGIWHGTRTKIGGVSEACVFQFVSLIDFRKYQPRPAGQLCDWCIGYPEPKDGYLQGVNGEKIYIYMVDVVKEETWAKEGCPVDDICMFRNGHLNLYGSQCYLYVRANGDMEVIDLSYYNHYRAQYVPGQGYLWSGKGNKYEYRFSR